MPFILKGCMKCGGDVSLERDLYGPYGDCIQCGEHYENISSTVPDLNKRKDRGSHRVNYGIKEGDAIL